MEAGFLTSYYFPSTNQESFIQSAAQWGGRVETMGVEEGGEEEGIEAPRWGSLERM